MSFTIRFEGLKVAGAGFVFIQVSAFRLSCIVGKDYVTGTFMDTNCYLIYLCVLFLCFWPVLVPLESYSWFHHNQGFIRRGWGPGICPHPELLKVKKCTYISLMLNSVSSNIYNLGCNQTLISVKYALSNRHVHQCSIDLKKGVARYTVYHTPSKK